MRLTREQAIDRSIELWEWLAESGELKHAWSGWDKYGDTHADCFLCEYANGYCNKCPYFKQFGDCTDAGKPYEKWDYVLMPFYRKKYAKLFLEQLKGLKK